MNSEFQYVHEASVARTCEPSTSRCRLSSKSAFACRSIPITCSPLSNALRRVAICDPAGDLVCGQEAEPDRELEAEVRPPAGQDSTAG